MRLGPVSAVLWLGVWEISQWAPVILVRVFRVQSALTLAAASLSDVIIFVFLLLLFIAPKYAVKRFFIGRISPFYWKSM